MFDIYHSGDECAALCHYRAPELKVKLLVWLQMQSCLESAEIALEVGNRMSVRVSVVNSEATAYINSPDIGAERFKMWNQLIDFIA